MRDMMSDIIRHFSTTVLMSGKFFSLVELLMYGTVYPIVFVLLVLLFLRNVLELLILVSF